MEKAVLMMDYLNVTQRGENDYTHKGDKAIDLAGKDIGKDPLKAPFTGTIKKIYASDNAVWLESNNKVLYADGTIDYMTVLTLHDNDISNLAAVPAKYFGMLQGNNFRSSNPEITKTGILWCQLYDALGLTKKDLEQEI